MCPHADAREAGRPLELADIFRTYGETYRTAHPLSRQQRRVMRAIEMCRTPALGSQTGVLGVISRKFSVREIATKSPLVARTDYIRKNNTFCYTLLHTPSEM